MTSSLTRQRRLQGPLLQLFRRLYSSKENLLLADALNLLSPSAGERKHVTHKPSMIKHLTQGSAYDPVKYPGKLPSKGNEDLTKSVKHLLDDLSLVGVQKDHIEVSNASPTELRNHIRAMTDEVQIAKLVRILFYQNRLSYALLLETILNPNLRKLLLLPFDVNHLDQKQFEKNGWTEVQSVQFKVILLKKYHDLKRPLSIVKNIKENFSHTFLPLIREGKLPPFYERIVWKFKSEYQREGYSPSLEAHYVAQLSSLKSSVLIWEASSWRSASVALDILAHHDLNELQRAFFRICSHPSVVDTIHTQLIALGDRECSSLLSDLKAISIKHKIYTLPVSLKGINTETRATAYLMVNAMTKVAKQVPELSPILQDLQDIKQNSLMNLSEEETLNFFLALSVR